MSNCTEQSTIDALNADANESEARGNLERAFELRQSARARLTSTSTEWHKADCAYHANVKACEGCGHDPHETWGCFDSHSCGCETMWTREQHDAFLAS